MYVLPVEDRRQRSEVRSQRSEVRGQGAEIYGLQVTTVVLLTKSDGYNFHIFTIFAYE